MAEKRGSRGSGLFKNTLILSLAGMACKAMGMVYRIRLGGLLGAAGMGRYQLAYSLYAALLVAAGGGIPAALSALVAAKAAKRDADGARACFCCARRWMLGLGLAGGAAFYWGSGLLAGWTRLPPALLQAAAPAVVFGALSAAYRGYFQGSGRAAACAGAQLTEQAVKLLGGLWLASRAVGCGEVEAMWGVTCSEGAGLLAAMLQGRSDHPSGRSLSKSGQYSRALLRAALPITFGSAVLPMLHSAESMVAVRLLGRGEAATATYGLYSGFALPVAGLPAILTSAAAAALIPAVAAAMANDRKDLLSRALSQGLKAAWLLGLPAAVGLWLLAEPLMQLLYGRLSGEELTQAAHLLRLLCPGVAFAMAGQVTGGMLQGMGQMLRPTLHLLAGCGIRLGAAVVLVPRLGVAGLAVGSTLGNGVCAALGISAILQRGGRVQVGTTLYRPLIACGGMAAAAYGGYAAFTPLGLLWGVLGAVLFGAATYVLLLWMLGSVSKGDLVRAPDGAPLGLRE